MSGKRYAIIHRSWWNRTQGHTISSLRILDLASGEMICAPRFNGSPTLSSIYARAEEALGHPIETSQAWVDSVEVGSRSKLHNA